MGNIIVNNIFILNYCAVTVGFYYFSFLDYSIQKFIGITLIFLSFLSFYLYGPFIFKNIAKYSLFVSYLYLIGNIFLINIEYQQGFLDSDADSLSLGYAEFFINSVAIFLCLYIILVLISRMNYFSKLTKK